MNRYQLDNAAHKIDGYWIPASRTQTPAKNDLLREFTNAKNATIAQLEIDLQNVRDVTFEEFCSFKRITF